MEEAGTAIVSQEMTHARIEESPGTLRTQLVSQLQPLVLWDLNCGPRPEASVSPGSPRQNLRSHPDVLNKNLHFS